MVNAVELLAAEKVLQEKKKEAHKAKTKLEKTNATLLADAKPLEKHRELQGAEPKFIRTNHAGRPSGGFASATAGEQNSPSQVNHRYGEACVYVS